MSYISAGYAQGASPTFNIVNAVGYIEAVTAYSTTGSILVTDSFITVSGTITRTLPTAVGVKGRVYTIKMTGSGVVTLDTTGGQTIDGASTYVLRDTNGGIALISDGSNWLVKGVF